MISFRTAYQRGTAACELLRDLKLRATNPITVEVCDLCIKLISAPPHEREAVDERIVELVAQATARRSRLQGNAKASANESKRRIITATSPALLPIADRRPSAMSDDQLQSEQSRLLDILMHGSLD